MKKNIFSFLLILCVWIFPSLGFYGLAPAKGTNQVEKSLSSSNQKSALRCLKLAKDSASIKNWNAAASQASLGLSYDDSISDLWYMMALCENNSGGAKADVIPLVKNALEKNNWVNYFRDDARLLYADLLCDTGLFGQVESILDQEPKVLSCDADFVRAKAYYRTNSPDSILKARKKIDTARKLYPQDTRFPYLFFTMENPDSKDESLSVIKKFYIKQILQYDSPYPDENADLEILAASFASGADRLHLLESFKARNLSHPLYAKLAMEEGLLSESEALSYFTSFCDREIDFKYLVDFLSSLTEEDSVEKAADYLNAFSGSIFRDTDGDGIYNMYVKYSRGRPQIISYDKNQDGKENWKIVCDFGQPLSGHISEYKMDFSWGTYPYLKSCVFKDEKGNDKFTFDIVEDTFAWSPFSLIDEKEISSVTGKVFYFPQLNLKGADLTQELLIEKTRGFSTPTNERKNGRIYFATLDGKLQSAKYSQDGKVYAHAVFENDLPLYRLVDNDGDGIFETSEFYACDENNEMIHSMEDERAVLTKIYGLPSNAAPFYLRMIQVDRDKDSVADYTEEYTAGNGKISSWDNDNDGKWEVRYVRYGKSFDESGNEEPLKEDAMFYQNKNGNLVTITSFNKIPKIVKCANKVLNVTKDSAYMFYWVGKEGDSDFAKKISKAFVNIVAGQSIMINSDSGARVLLVKVNGCNFANVIE